jgi:hypothetical protein
MPRSTVGSWVNCLFCFLSLKCCALHHNHLYQRCRTRLQIPNSTSASSLTYSRTWTELYNGSCQLCQEAHSFDELECAAGPISANQTSAVIFLSRFNYENMIIAASGMLEVSENTFKNLFWFVAL